MKNKMQLSSNGLAQIQSEEGFITKPYNDTAQNATIAFGHLLHKGPVTPADWKIYGKGITLEQGLILLKQDAQWAVDEVNRVVQEQLNQNQFDAMVSFTYNEGSGTLEKSSVLSYLNAGDNQQAMYAILEYDYAGGKPSEGLLNRRKKEVALFNTPVSA